MSSVAVPKKMVPVPNVYGVEAFKEIKPEIVALHPVQHKNTRFETEAQNRISFRVPAYSNALLDNSRSFLHMKVATKATTGAYFANGLPILSRMVVKTSAGLTLEDVSDFDILNAMLDTFTPADAEELSMYGNMVTGFGDEADDFRITRLPYMGSSGNEFATTANYKEVLLKFNHGIFSKHLTKFLPLFMADGGAGYSFDVDLYLSDNGLSWDTNATLDAYTESYPKIAIHSPVWYMHLMRMDEGLARRFNQMAVHGEEIRIPFTTWHTHRTSLVAEKIIAYIHENATNFKKILTCIHKPGQRLIRHDNGGTDGHALEFTGMQGGVRNTNNKVNSYNYRVGIQHVYNEPVAEVGSNIRTMQFVKSAFGLSDSVLHQMDMLSKEKRDTKNNAIRMFEKERWCAVASFDYSPTEQGVIQGISTSNPVELSLSVSDFAEGSIVLNYCELAYDLVFKGGSIHYEEQKPGSQSVY